MPSDPPPACAAPDASHVRLDLPSEPGSIAIAVARIRVLLAGQGADERAHDRVEIAVREAIANAIEHGNGGDPRRRVTVVARVDAGTLEVAVGDEGTGFDAATIPDPRRPERLLAPDGRGLLLMRSLMDDVCLHPSRVVLRTRLDHYPPPPQEAEHP